MRCAGDRWPHRWRRARRSGEEGREPVSFFLSFFVDQFSTLSPPTSACSLVPLSHTFRARPRSPFKTPRTLGDLLAQHLDSSARSKKAAAAAAAAAGASSSSASHSSSARGGKASSSGKTGSSDVGRRPPDPLSLPLATRHLAASALYGAAVVGPLGHAWYRWLDAFVSARFVRGSAKFVVSKVLLDEVVFGPVHVAGFFATVVVVAEGGGLPEIAKKVKRDFVSTYAAEFAFWPAFQAVNFWRVPVRHQLLAVNLACLLDATFLCWASAHDDWVSAAKGALGMEVSELSSSKGGGKRRAA